MHTLQIINYYNFSSEELCQYLEERYYTQILSDMLTVQKYLTQLACNEDSDVVSVMNVVFQQLEQEVKQLFTKDKLLLFPYFKKQTEVNINLQPVQQIHQKIQTILIQLRKLLNNYIQQPDWSNGYKICVNELYALEQSIHQVLYIKENYLWAKLNKQFQHE